MTDAVTPILPRPASIGQAAPHDATGAELPAWRLWAGFTAMGLGMFMAILDVQIVAASLPTIRAALGIDQAQMSAVQTAYLTAEIVAVPLTGWLTRLLSMRGLFVLATLVFTLASLGCAASQGFNGLIAWRVVQGFAGGTLIPLLFAAVFQLFPGRGQAVATMIAGVLAVLAPTSGPLIGGTITAVWSWHGLFLINLAPGLAAVLVGGLALPRQQAQFGMLRRLDLAALVALVVTLAALEVGLEQAPTHGWLSGRILVLLAVTAAGAAWFTRRTLRSGRPILDLGVLSSPAVALACALSFLLGFSLFGSVYLMPVFLAFVRGHDSLEIGRIMLVTGLAQVVAAPVAVVLERRVSPVALTGTGFLCYAAGLGWSAFATPAWDHWELLGPQALRGVAVMFCLLPPTRLALGTVAPAHVADASGLFNMMRNLGGAIGISMVNTVLQWRGPEHGAELVRRLAGGDAETAAFMGLPPGRFHGTPLAQNELAQLAFMRPLIEHGSLTLAANDAYAVLAALMLLGVAVVSGLREKAHR